ncbi:UrcA family protein [Sphingomonas cavernae]|uniref:UrcA family protein n=1 Tax=Sphingomonas cavernae TaxID=2320861 RepID=A0A418WNT3_9SPHN|nr:UrcA family protein [Sphingomonas cavernae]RJF92894.1 UrcA family protein [Sphingomonas cavernae]
MKTMLALTALAGALYVAPATAQSPADGTNTRVVRYADLDLGTEKGRDALDRRIRVAVSAACGTASSVDPEGKREVRRCKADTLAHVAAQRDQAIASLQTAPTLLASQ